MDCTATQLPYRQTGYFSKIITDYFDKAPALLPFYEHPVSLEGIKNAIANRKRFNTDRNAIAAAFQKQYRQLPVQKAVQSNIEKLQAQNSFTITSAHQPAIFTGSLYFIYKILHSIKLAAFLSASFPDSHFIPVFYMGSEDADLDELGKIYLDGEKITWETKQQGAVGRMKTKGLEKIIDRIAGEFAVQPFGDSLITLLKEAYLQHDDVQTATQYLLHQLFGHYGLLVLNADQPELKQQMQKVFEDDLLNQQPSAIVAKTIASLSAHYKVQANPRDINLFYLKDDIRERIVLEADGQYHVHGTKIIFTKDELLAELKAHPERFSPNVILRGLYQETILPNLVFIGGGGETAYWLELKELFHHYKVPFPMLLLRNSFLVIEERWKNKMDHARISIEKIFEPESILMDEIVKKSSANKIELSPEIEAARKMYQQLAKDAENVDPTLKEHIAALEARALKPLHELEKKLLRAEKRKFSEQQAHIHSIKKALFPNNGLQERVDNFMPYFAKWGSAFFDALYQHSPSLDPQFVVMEVKD